MSYRPGTAALVENQEGGGKPPLTEALRNTEKSIFQNRGIHSDVMPSLFTCMYVAVNVCLKLM